MTSAIEPPAGDEIHVWQVALGEGGREAARSALGALLARYLETDGVPELSSGEHGKPRLAVSPERLAFNLSHSGELALVAIAPGEVEVGVDIERLRPRRDLVRLASRWLPAEDAAAVVGASEAERKEVFYAAWTRFEARVKCTGAGIAGPRPGPEVVALELAIDAGYAAAVAVAGIEAAAKTAAGAPGGAPIFVHRFEFAG
jgi:4'-phosphopantetheinyl transferase